MDEDRNGTVVTFYSYSGGTGRTMALANVAWILASGGARVLAVDLDLESPALHRFFGPFVPRDVGRHGGITELIREYEWAAELEIGRDRQWVRRHARVDRHVSRLDWPFAGGGSLDFLPAGRNNEEYAAPIAGKNWDEFYEASGGGQFFRALRDDMKSRYDYTLIDSCAGLNEIADACKIDLPDVVVDCFTLSQQSIDGAARTARMIGNLYRRRNIRVLPVPMRVDASDPARVEIGRTAARRRFDGLPVDLHHEARDRYWDAVEVPYDPDYSYEETLAVLAEPPGRGGGLLPAYESLARELTNGAVAGLTALDGDVRLAAAARFHRRAVAVDDDVCLRYRPVDRVWAEWIAEVLLAVGVRVDDDSGPAAEPGAHPPGRVLMVLSAGSSAIETEHLPPLQGDQPEPLAVYVDDRPPAPRVSRGNSATIAALAEEDAIREVLRLVGRADAAAGVAAVLSLRFPGRPGSRHVPARNPDFVGRDAALAHIRAELRRRRTRDDAEAEPLVLHGLGGIGKTELALEYAHRFAGAYDVVGWIDARVPASVAGQLSALGVPSPRWLLIFDGAEDPGVVPGTPADVLITTRDASRSGRRVDVDAFAREESVEVLRRSDPGMSPAEAARIAAELGDLPVAVGAVATRLAARDGLDPEGLYDVERAVREWLAEDARWDSSLRRLRETSPAAYRLLELCAVMASEISPDIVTCEALAAHLRPLEPMDAEPLGPAGLARLTRRLALIRVSSIDGRIIVHPLLQRVVRERMPADDLAAARRDVHAILASCRPNGEVDDPDSSARFAALWPHVTASGAMGSADGAVRQLVIDHLRYLHRHGENDNGLALADAVEADWSARLGEFGATEPGDTLEAPLLRRQLLRVRAVRASILRELGAFAQALAVDESVRAEQLVLLGRDHPHTLRGAGGLAADLLGLGRYADAVDLARETYASWLVRCGSLHPDTFAAQSRLAAACRLAGRAGEALELDRAAYRGRAVQLGPDHPDTLGSAGDIGRDLRDLGEYPESVSLLTELAERYDGLPGALCRDVAAARLNLAASLRRAGRVEDAARLVDTVLERLIRMVGPTDLSALAGRTARALHLLASDDPRAEPELLQVRRAYADRFGPAHPYPLICTANLAGAVRGRTDLDAARDLAGDAAVGLAAALGEDHPIALAGRVNAAINVAEAGDLTRARDMVKGAVTGGRAVLGQRHPDTLCWMANQAIIERRLGLGEFETGMDALLRGITDRIGAGHPVVERLRERQFVYHSIDIPA